MLSILGVSESKSINHQLTQRTCPPWPPTDIDIKEGWRTMASKMTILQPKPTNKATELPLVNNLSNITVTRLCQDPMWYQKKKAREQQWINKGSVKNNILAIKSLPRTLSYRQERGKHVGCNLQAYRQFLFNNCQCIYI